MQSVNQFQAPNSPVDAIMKALAVAKDIYGIKGAAQAHEKIAQEMGIQKQQADYQKAMQTAGTTESQQYTGPLGQLLGQDLSNMSGSLAEKYAPIAAEVAKNKQALGFEKFKMSRLSPDQIKDYSEGSDIVNRLQDLKNAYQNNTDVQGPVAGPTNTLQGVKYAAALASKIPVLNSLIPSSMQSDENKIQRADALRSASAADQVSIAKYLMGQGYKPGAEKVYEKMFPSNNEHPEENANRIQNLIGLVSQKQNQQRAALQSQGYNVDQLPSSSGGQSALASVLAGPKGKKPTNEGTAFAGEAGPHGSTVMQNGHTYTWNPKTKQYE